MPPNGRGPGVQTIEPDHYCGGIPEAIAHMCVCVWFYLSSQDAIVTTGTKESHAWKQESWVFMNYKQKTFLGRKPKLGGRGKW